MRIDHAGLAVALLMLAGCAVPPQSAYVSGHGSGGRQSGLDVGQNAAGESCTQQEIGGGGADVYCGTYEQPSARVRAGGRADPAQLAQLATGSTWRAGLNQRYTCEAPSPTTILGDVPAVLLSCVRKIGGWPQVALVASVGGNVWYADGVLPAYPAMERSLGVISGKLSATAARQQPGSEADRLMAQRLAAHAFSSGDVKAYDDLMAAGARANRDEDFPTSEQDFAAALAVQQKALGQNGADTTRPLAWLALELSDQERFSDADARLARAQRLMDAGASGGALDADLSGLLLYVRGLDQKNRGHRQEALELLRQAEAAYAALLPSDVLNARPRPVQAQIFATQTRGSTAGIADLLPDRDLLTDVTTRSALLGVIEARRHEAIVLREMGRESEADATLNAAENLTKASGLRNWALDARLARTAAQDAAVQRDPAEASSNFSVARTEFAIGVPMSRPVAETELLRAGQLARLHQDDAALHACDEGVGLLRTLKIGTTGTLLAPCLEVMHAAAERSASQPGGAAALAGAHVRGRPVDPGHRHHPADRHRHRAVGRRCARPAHLRGDPPPRSGGSGTRYAVRRARRGRAGAPKRRGDGGTPGRPPRTHRQGASRVRRRGAGAAGGRPQFRPVGAGGCVRPGRARGAASRRGFCRRRPRPRRGLDLRAGGRADQCRAGARRHARHGGSGETTPRQHRGRHRVRLAAALRHRRRPQHLRCGLRRGGLAA